MISCPRMRTATLVVLMQVSLACSPDEAEPSMTVRGVGTLPVGIAGRAAVGGNGATGTAGTPAIGVVPGVAGVGAIAGAPTLPPPAGAPAMPGIAGTPALAGRPGGTAGTGGMAAVAAGMMAATAGALAPGDDMFAAERQACVDHINMYRATMMLAPLKRATPELEKCSDDGAKMDGDSGQAHGSAGSCRGLGGQNTCPGYPVRAGGTITTTLKGCLDQMWAEGEPPNGTQACIADRTGCFLMHGHWINMSMANYGTVACGFYKMTSGSYWMNQNFGR
jgi:hypothetical protein